MNSSKRQRILDGVLEADGVRTVLDRTGRYRQALYDSFADKGDCFLRHMTPRWSGSKPGFAPRRRRDGRVGGVAAAEAAMHEVAGAS